MYPLISCVCITRGKPAMLHRVITCFRMQSYPNKELVVVYEEDDTPTVAYVQQGGLEDVSLHCVKTDAQYTLGELRNIGIEKAAGEFVCQWDDDDWYHANRLERQYHALQQHHRAGAVLTRWMVYDAVKQNAYISNYRIWEGSILCRKDIMSLKPYENKRIGEDTATTDYLSERNFLHLIDDQPALYIYIYHGNNTWNAAHWAYIFECSEQLPEADARQITDILNGAYDGNAGSALLDDILKRFRHASLPE